MEDQAPSTTGDALSDDQWIVIYLIRICSASLSLLGSSALVYKILRDRAQYGSLNAYERFILLLSSSDILATITLCITPFLYPEGTDVWTFGNAVTCRMAGFLTGFAVIWNYWNNGLLSYYFLLTVLSQFRQKNLVRKFELFMHLSGLFFPIAGIVGLFLGWFNDTDPCLLTNEIAGWITAGIPILFVFLSLVINNIVIYTVLKKSIRSSEQSSEQQRRKREARTLMFLYVGCFFITVTPPFLYRLYEDYLGYTAGNRGKLYPLLVIQAIFLPLQGFFNFLIYIRPMYSRFRAANPNKPIHFVLHEALFNPRVPQLYRRRVAQHITHASSSVIFSVDTFNPNQALFNANPLTMSDSTGPSSSSGPSSD